MRRIEIVCAMALLWMVVGVANAQNAGSPPAPPSNVSATDHPLDGGKQIDLRWNLSPSDPKSSAAGGGSPSDSEFAGYKVYRSLTDGEIAGRQADAIAKAGKAAKDEVTRAYLASHASGAADSRAFQRLTNEQKSELQRLRKQAADAASQARERELAMLAGKVQWEFLTTTMPGENSITIDKLSRNAAYTFKIEAYTLAGDSSEPAITTEAVSPVLQWFDGGRLWLAIIAFILCFSIVFWIGRARAGRPIKVRKIAGLDAVDEAVGRATEMGRPCLFVPGVQDMNDIQTIAGITVLSRVARTAAEYDAKVEVPTSRSLVMTTAREAVQASFLAAGRPDAYNQDLIYYVTDEQFGYVAYLSGMMVREKPAACFYMGSFFAESLILAETGNSIGAIQVAGTAQPAQLPFFVAACDYTLIGEEFFAASAYLSGSPEELGSLKGQDVGKLIVWIFMVIGVTLYTLAVVTGNNTFMAMVNYIRGEMLT